MRLQATIRISYVSNDLPQKERLTLHLAEQLTYPGTRISTLQETFDFVECADPEHQILWNIESKVDANQPNKTVSPEDFANAQYAVFASSVYKNSITVSLS